MAMEDRDYFQADRDRRRGMPADGRPAQAPQKPLGPIKIRAYDDAMAGRKRADLKSAVIWVLLVAVGVLVVLLLRR